MSHPSERELVLSLLGDDEERIRLETHLRDCADCRARVEALRGVLSATEEMEVPEPDAAFEARIWERQRAHLRLRPIAGGGGHVRRPPAGRWMMAGAIAASLLVAFALGILVSSRGGDAPPRAGRDRVLLVAVGDHLESARMVLVELANAEETDPGVAGQQVRAERLLGANRLYRQSAALQGDRGMVEILEEVERVLLEVARAPGDMPAEDLEWLRERIASGDLIFRVSVVEGKARAAGIRRGGI